MDQAPGGRLGPYRIEAPLGAGGMGEVYRATDTKLGREVAIKVLPADFAQDKDRLARFEREAKLLASLNHPNIAHVYAFESATINDGTAAHFLAMELVEGEDLAARLKGGPIPLEEALGIARQVAEGLEQAHEHGIVHRDLKPANVKVTGDGRVKVLDFGLAKAYASETAGQSGPDLSQSPTLARTGTQAGVILGTAAYMSPEQARGKPVDKRSDIWAFGVVLFEMLTGKPLFKGETASDVLAAVLRTEPDWSGLPAITPVAIRRLLRRCLDRDPRRRLHDIADARIVIEDVVSGVDSGEVGSFGLASVAGARLRRPSLLWLGALGVMAAAAGLGGYFARGRGARAPVPTHLAIQLPADLELLTGALLAFSPDGNSLVFSARQDGKPSLFRRKLSDRVAEPIPGTEGGANAFFSPDGRWIGFSAEGQVRKVASEGGRPFPLGESRGAGGCAWLADGTIVFAPLYSDGLFRMSAEGGVAARLTTPDRKDGQLGHWWPDPLPGGQRVLFTTFRTPVDRSRIGVLDLGTGEVRWVVEGGFFARYVSS